MGAENRASHSSAQECRRFARYLVDAEPGAPELERYVRAVATFPPVKQEDRLLTAARASYLIPVLDAGTAWLRLDCAFRRRLTLAAAILETSPAHAERFLPCTTSIARMFLLGTWTALRMAVLVPAGVILVKALHRS